MKCSRQRRLVQATLLGVVFAGLVVFAPENAAHAGDRLTVEELATRSEAAVVVKVSGRARRLTLVEVIGGTPKTPETTAAWLNACVPDRAHLRQWLNAHRRWRERRFWRKALSVPSFRAVLFLRTIDSTLRPSCETESMLMRHTSVHPHFPRYLEEARRAWEQR